MTNPFALIIELAKLIVSVNESNREALRRQAARERTAAERLREEKAAAEHRRWVKATEESYENPDDWSVLPYGWSPFPGLEQPTPVYERTGNIIRTL